MIYLDSGHNRTISICEICGLEDSIAGASGSTPPEWGSGQLWLDISLSDQKSFPICFCPACKIDAFTATAFKFEISQTEPSGVYDPRAELSLSRVEFFLAVRRGGYLSSEETLEAIRGVAPQTLVVALEGLPVELSEEILYRFAGASIFERTDPFLIQAAYALGLTDEDLDVLFEPPQLSEGSILDLQEQEGPFSTGPEEIPPETPEEGE